MTTSHNSNVIPADDVIRGFLLGRLDTVEQEKFEEQLMTDESLHGHVRHAEFQLADEFTWEQIGRIDRQRFLKTFLVTGERKRMVAVSDYLKQRFSGTRERSLTEPAGWSWLSIFHQRVFRFAFGVLVLLLLIGSFWLVTREPQIVRKLIPKRLRPRPAATSTPQEANHPSNAAPPVHRDSSPSQPEHESSPGPTPETQIVTTLALSPGVLNDVSQMPVITLPEGGVGVVRLELAVEQNIWGEFQAELLSNTNPAFAGNVRKAGASRLAIDVPADVLKPGDYEIRLSRIQDGSKQAVANYYFSVRQR